MNILKRNFVKYGLIMTSLVAVCLLAMEVTGQNDSFNKSPLTLFYTFIAPAIVWYFGIKAFKKAHNNHITFKQGVMEGFRISLVFGLVSPFIFMLYYLLVNPEILAYVKESYSLTGASNATVIGVDMVIQFFSSLFFGTIYAAIITVILKTNRTHH